jgi:6-phosphogluconolactonase
MVKFKTSISMLVTGLMVAVMMTACGGGGDGIGSIIGGGSNTLYPRYAYLANGGDNSVSTYAVNAATGRLKYIGKADAGASPSMTALHPSGQYAYVVNSSDETVSQYTIGSDGSLSVMTTATVAAGL